MRTVKALIFIIAFLSVGAVAFFAKPLLVHAPPEAGKTIAAAMDPKCRFPITYSLGSIDPRFGVSRPQFLEAIGQATKIWQTGTGQRLFAYADTGGMPVNLVFDDRQAETDRMEQILLGVETDQGKYDAAKKEYDAKQTAFISERRSYDATLAKFEAARTSYGKDVDSYNDRVHRYEAKVSDWNSRGGASDGVFSKLQDEESTLRSLTEKLAGAEEDIRDLQRGLEAKRNRVNMLADEANSLAGIVNTLAERIGGEIETYNGTRGMESFITGLYSEEGAKRSVDIYQFSDMRELILILTHELGHALGLTHASSEEAIMFERIAKQEKRLSSEDTRMFSDRCGK
jgi:hypothetical protein